MRYKRKICLGCNQTRFIVAKKLCLTCYNRQRKIHTKRRPKASTGELAVFKEIWEERPHVSQVSGEPINEFDVWCFSHLLPKSVYPAYRLNKENIWLVTREEHIAWQAGKAYICFDSKKERAQQLKIEYNQKVFKTGYHFG